MTRQEEQWTGVRPRMSNSSKRIFCASRLLDSHNAQLLPIAGSGKPVCHIFRNAFLARHNRPDSGVRQRFQNRCERKAKDMLDAFGLEYLSDGLTALHDDFSLGTTGACIGECGYHRILP